MNNQYETFIQSLKIQKAKHPNTYNSGSQGEGISMHFWSFQQIGWTKNTTFNMTDIKPYYTVKQFYMITKVMNVLNSA